MLTNADKHMALKYMLAAANYINRPIKKLHSAPLKLLYNPFSSTEKFSVSQLIVLVFASLFLLNTDKNLHTLPVKQLMTEG